MLSSRIESRARFIKQQQPHSRLFRKHRSHEHSRPGYERFTENEYHPEKRGVTVLDYSHSQPLHLTSAQLNRVLVPDAPDSLTDQIVIDLRPGLGLRVTEYMPSIPDRSFQVSIEPFGHLVDELFGTAKSCSLSDPGFIVCVPGVPKCDVVFDLSHAKLRISNEVIERCFGLGWLTVKGKWV